MLQGKPKLKLAMYALSCELQHMAAGAFMHPVSCFIKPIITLIAIGNSGSGPIGAFVIRSLKAQGVK